MRRSSCTCTHTSCYVVMGWGGLRSRLGKEVGHPLNSPLACVWLKYFIEGSLEVKLPTIWTDEKQSRAEAERRERLEERRSEKRKSHKKKTQMHEKVGKSRNTVFF